MDKSTKDEGVNEIQEIHFRLIRRATFNEFDGGRVADDLLARRDLWEAVMMDREAPLQLIKLRDMPDDYWNVDTLFILTTDAGAEGELEEMAERWKADDFSFYSVSRDREEMAAQGLMLGTSSDGLYVARIWWD